ncbi:hypothetical protein K0I63_03655 [Shewanella rhizosphaerae]|uniref:hypothetical protein n=1 Tax=Shewanella TaxID=22 RepID=UPI001C65C471|nr:MULTISPECIES: hypothetical protein [Shewanella]QYJ90709.1 hypothetical protein K0H81_03680 [Shewanella halotolerans]QYK13624.1 hypothetical protein K0I63_03655 [Shewanella rhizosphaerae]
MNKLIQIPSTLILFFASLFAQAQTNAIVDCSDCTAAQKSLMASDISNSNTYKVYVYDVQNSQITIDEYRTISSGGSDWDEESYRPEYWAKHITTHGPNSQLAQTMGTPILKILAAQMKAQKELFSSPIVLPEDGSFDSAFTALEAKEDFTGYATELINNMPEMKEQYSVADSQWAVIRNNFGIGKGIISLSNPMSVNVNFVFKDNTSVTFGVSHAVLYGGTRITIELTFKDAYDATGKRIPRSKYTVNEYLRNVKDSQKNQQEVGDLVALANYLVTIEGINVYFGDGSATVRGGGGSVIIIDLKRMKSSE